MVKKQDKRINMKSQVILDGNKLSNDFDKNDFIFPKKYYCQEFQSKTPNISPNNLKRKTFI